jgi:hypothetical protein
MTTFEIIVSLFTIVYGIILTDLFSSLHKLIKAKKRVKWNFLPLLVSWYLLLIILKNWWAMAIDGDAIKEYNFLYFLAYAHLMVLLYLLVSVVLPDEVPEEGVDLKTYYFKNQKYLYGLMIGVGVLSISINTIPQVVESAPLNIPNLIAFVVFLVLTAMLMFSKKYWLHIVLMSVFTLITIMEIIQNMI